MKLYEYLVVWTSNTFKRKVPLTEIPEWYFVGETTEKILYKSKSANKVIQWGINHVQTDNIAGADTGQKRGTIKVLKELDLTTTVEKE